MLQADRLGYEDLLLVLAKDYNIKIYMNTMRKILFNCRGQQRYYVDNKADAQLIVQVVENVPNVNQYIRLVTNVSVAFIGSIAWLV